MLEVWLELCRNSSAALLEPIRRQLLHLLRVFFCFFPLWQAIKDEDPLLRLMLELLPEPLQEPFAGALAGMPCRKSFQEALQVPFRKP